MCFNNFQHDISLDDVSALANMNKEALCRYFKSRTRKTFVEFVNSIRIGHACKLIAEGETQIANLAHDCGFNSLSNFNKLFKEIKGTTPSEYRKLIEANRSAF
jgi:AraC-like DNA-binding protein